MKKRNQKVAKRQSSGRWPTYMLMLVCGLVLVSGIFLAGRQHFSSMDYGMKNSRLRKQVDELEAEKRRLLLAREVSLSPAEIKKAAQKSGMFDPAAAGLVAQVASVTKEKAAPLPPATSPAKSMIVKTAAVVSTALPTTMTISYPKPERDRIAKPVKKTITAE